MIQTRSPFICVIFSIVKAGQHPPERRAIALPLKDPLNLHCVFLPGALRISLQPGALVGGQ
jgi:hypothetical protein